MHCEDGTVSLCTIHGVQSRCSKIVSTMCDTATAVVCKLCPISGQACSPQAGCSMLQRLPISWVLSWQTCISVTNHAAVPTRRTAVLAAFVYPKNAIRKVPANRGPRSTLVTSCRSRVDSITCFKLCKLASWPCLRPGPGDKPKLSSAPARDHSSSTQAVSSLLRHRPIKI